MRNDRYSFAARTVSALEKRPYTTVALFILLALGPFINKAVHIDDSLFVWAAEQIIKHPGDFYGFDVNWYGTVESMAAVNCNPPATSYLLAGAIAAFGEHEFVLHGVMMLVAFAAAAGIFQLAKLWCDRPLLATFIALGAPVFLVSATTLMCDLPMLAAWVWSVVLWERALKDGKAAQYLGAALLASLAVMTKYSALTLLPLLPILAVARKRSLGAWLLWLVVPVLVVGLYQMGTAKLYGHGLITAAADYASETRFGMTGGWLNKLVIGLAYAGGCLLPVSFFAWRLWPRRAVMWGAATVVSISFAIVFAGGLGQQFGGWFQLQMAVLMAGGIHLFLVAFAELWRRRDIASLMLLLWGGSVFLFASVLNWTVSARSFLPLAPAAGILVVRSLAGTEISEPGPARFGLLVAFSLAFSLTVAVADMALANSGRTAAGLISSIPSGSDSRLCFEGHCGFQFYLQKAGGLSVDFSRTVLKPGQILVVPSNNSNLLGPDSRDVDSGTELKVPACTWLSTVNGETGAGFYGAGGWLPFVVGPVPPERYFVYRITRTTCFAPPEVLNNIAWQLATSTNAEARNGPEAVALAQRACEATKYRETVIVGTLAAAYAEAGEFEQAVATAQQACDLASVSGETNLLRSNQKLLEFYRARQPVRQ